MNICDDEFAFLKYNDIVYSSATPAHSQASLEAKKNNKPFHKIISTTPGDLKTPAGVFSKKFFDNAARFDEKMYDWSLNEVEDYIEKNSINNFIYVEFSYKQLGRSEDWFKKQCRDLNMDRFKINREILLQWNKSSDISPFTEEEVEKLYHGVVEPIATLMVKKFYPFNIYKDFDWHKTLMIGVDVSGGYSRDGSAITIVDSTTLEVLADFNNNIVDSVELSEIIMELVSKFFINGPIIIERNSYGKAIIDILLKTPISNRLYFEVKKVKAEKKVVDVKDQKFETRITRSYGVNTDSATRPQMIDLLRGIINDEYNKLNSKRLIDDIAGLERKKNGKIEHGDISHDDNLFSYLIIRWVWAYGTNLSHFFINKVKFNTSSDGDSLNSSQEFVNSFLMVSMMNKENKQNKELTSGKIIEEWSEYQNKVKQKEDEQIESQQRDIFNRILSFNKKIENED